MGPGLLYACPGRRPREEGAAGVGRLLLLLLAVPPPIHHCRWSCLCLCQGSPVPSLPLHPGEIPGEHQHLKESQLPFFQIRQGAPSQPFLFRCFCTKPQRPSHLLRCIGALVEMETSVWHRAAAVNIEVAQQARTHRLQLKDEEVLRCGKTQGQGSQSV